MHRFSNDCYLVSGQWQLTTCHWPLTIPLWLAHIFETVAGVAIPRYGLACVQRVAAVWIAKLSKTNSNMVAVS